MRSLSKYRTNQSIKKRVDSLLFQLQRIYANHGTNSKYDVGDKKSEKIAELKSKIKELSPIYYIALYPY